MSEIVLRTMQADEWREVAELICLGTNYWYHTHGMNPIFVNGPDSTELFCEVYEALDPGCCVIAVNSGTGKIVGSCFYHPRETHVSLGIMNVHPNYFGERVASKLLKFITDFADEADLPVRLVSSAMNLDSFSLYNRAGFVPQQTYQDMFVQVPADGMTHAPPPGMERVRAPTLDDVDAIVALEKELNQISREKDFRYFIDNKSGIWHGSVFESESGQLEGFLFSIKHPGSNMIGPGCGRDANVMSSLIYQELDQNRGGSPVILVPAKEKALVDQLYKWGARNCEIHFSQVRGKATTSAGICMPTFMPETA